MKKIVLLFVLLISMTLLSSCIVVDPIDNVNNEIDYTIEIYLASLEDTYVLDEVKNEKDPLGTFVTFDLDYLGFTINESLSNVMFVVSKDMDTMKIFYDRETYDISFYTSLGLYQIINFKFGETIEFPQINNVIGWKDVAGDEMTTSRTASQDERYYAIEEENTRIVFEGYYALLNDVNIDLWYDTLQEMIQSYTYVSYGDARDILQDSDEDPNNQDNVLLIYNRASVLSTWDAGVTWNREHVWPRSKLPNSISEADLHLLRASNPSLNSSRSNFSFVDGEGEARIIGSGWYPGDEDRGDIARIVFYVIMMWETNINLIGNLDTFLKWHEEDPVDDFERQRNQVIYAYQRNRNPFIDYPELVSIFYPQNDTVPQSYISFEIPLSYRQKNAHSVHFFINNV
ncbi:MAG: endonuclease [Firmicutes bacterium]|nr:endonuclease [Bacillota bacterium]